MEGRLGSHACLAFSLRTVIRRLLGWPSAAVAAAAHGCQNHSVLASSGMLAMWGQGADPQTYWLGRWPHYIPKLGIHHRLGLIAWKGMVCLPDHVF